LTSGTTPFENLISPFTHNTKENRKILFDQTILLFDSFSSAVRTTNNNSTGKVVIPLGKFQNKWGPVRYDAAGTTGQGTGLSAMLWRNFSRCNWLSWTLQVLTRVSQSFLEFVDHCSTRGNSL